MSEKPAKYKRGKHPNSQAALKHEGRPTDYGSRKPRHVIYVSQQAWAELDNVALECDCRSPSDLNEKIGRREVMAIRLPSGLLEILQQIEDAQSYLLTAVLSQLEADKRLQSSEAAPHSQRMR